jgi:NAD(P)-dependent dehydrogenase (short-subunit alcohol dehydrogenase family)
MEASGVALVTGASRGIGRAVALELCRRGFDVVATMRDPDDGAGLADEAAAAGASGSIDVQRLDVTDPSTMSMPDRLQVLVNNAGMEVPNLPLEHTSAAAWRQVFETNVFGLVEVTQRAIPVLRASGGGVIANVTSGGLLVPMPFFGVYRASKAAVSALGESMRAELAPFGIRVVEILPGPIDTDMLAASRVLPDGARYVDYAALAHRVGEMRSVSVEGTSTPTVEAATAIVDAILDDDGPLRHGCDPLGDLLLAEWRRNTDEENMSRFLRAFSVEP